MRILVFTFDLRSFVQISLAIRGRTVICGDSPNSSSLNPTGFWSDGSRLLIQMVRGLNREGKR